MPAAKPITPTPSLDVSPSWSRPRFAAVILVVAVVIGYWNSLHAPFLFDDLGAVEINPTIRKFSTALHPPADGSTTTGRPVLNLSFALNYALGGTNVVGYHLGNILIHAAAALALFGLVRRTLGGPRLSAQFGALASVTAFWCALLWAIHPLQTESVTSIAQRTESLCGVFYLLTFYGFARGANAVNSRGWLTLSVVACLIGMGTKEVTATAPVLVLLADRTFFAGTFAHAWRQRRGFYLALASTWLLLAMLVLSGGGKRGVAAGFGLGITPWEYLLKQCEALVLYLKLSVWPHPLVLDYGTAVVKSLSEVWWQGPLILALLGATMWALVRKPMLGFLGAWFFVILAPSSSFIPLVTQTMAEHRMYLPLVAVVIGGVFAIHRWLGVRASFVFAGVALVFGSLTILRNHDYRTGLAIWTDTVEKLPSNARAHINIGLELGKTGDRPAALAHFARAIELDTEFVSSGHYHSGATLLEMGQVEKALEHFETAVRIDPHHNDAQFALANALVKASRASESISHYEAAIAQKPAADAYANLGVALVRLNREAEALPNFEAALKLDPNLPGAHYHYAKALARAGRVDEALAHYTDAVRLAPDQAEIRNDYAVLLARRERFAEAATQLREAIRLKPDYAEAHANLGNTFLMQGDARQAITQYEEAIRLKPDDRRTRENLAIARESVSR